ncbi:hypothetical protein ACVWYN_002262 [Pedobacter sp. UYP24]
MGQMDSTGTVFGKVGKTVSYMLNGKNVIRNIGRTNKQPSVKQLADRQKIKLANEFLQPIIPFIKVGFKFAVEGTDKNAYNEGMSQIKKNAIIGEYPNQRIDYSLVKISSGTLESALNPKIQKLVNGVQFTWDIPSDLSWSLKRDRAMVMIYFPETHKAIYFLNSALRSEGSDFIELPENILNQNFEGYISFIAGDSASVSDSLHCEIV